MAHTPKADEALILKAWATKRAAAAEALNLTKTEAHHIDRMSEDELIAALIYKRNQAAQE